MIKSVLVIDDQKMQAEGIVQAFKKHKHDYTAVAAWEEDDIMDKIDNLFYNIAVIDLRMDKFTQDGFSFIKRIITANPFARVIIVSSYVGEYNIELTNILATGKVAAVLNKTDFDILTQQIFAISDAIVNAFYSSLNKSNINSRALANLYAGAKLEKDPIRKGRLFEDFIGLLFASMGFKHIYDRIIDLSRNEVDLIIRNDVSDSFIEKFGKYIFIECKNKPEGSVTKNDFIVFMEKVRNSNGLSKLGVIATTGYIASTTYKEAMRSSHDDQKIIFISSPEIERIIKSENFLDEFKKIIDSQVKDN